MKYSDILHLSMDGYKGVNMKTVIKNQRRAPTPPTTPPQTTWEYYHKFNDLISNYDIDRPEKLCDIEDKLWNMPSVSWFPDRPTRTKISILTCLSI